MFAVNWATLFEMLALIIVLAFVVGRALALIFWLRCQPGTKDGWNVKLVNCGGGISGDETQNDEQSELDGGIIKVSSTSATRFNPTI